MKRYLTSIIFGIGVLLLGLALLIKPVDDMSAAAIPTPIAFTHSAEQVNAPAKFWADGTVITQDGASSEFILAESEGLDIHYVIDQGPSTNTITLTLQFSNDGTNWVNGLNVIAASTTDQNNLLQFNNFGYRTRLWANVANTNNLTLTHVSALGRR
jgi:hypothetical protein